jgi:hypothetical protein
MPRLDRAPVKCIVYKMDEQLKAGIVTDEFHNNLNNLILKSHRGDFNYNFIKFKSPQWSYSDRPALAQLDY